LISAITSLSGESGAGVLVDVELFDGVGAGVALEGRPIARAGSAGSGGEPHPPAPTIAPKTQMPTTRFKGCTPQKTDNLLSIPVHPEMVKPPG